jgi:hypothetical protein
MSAPELESTARFVHVDDARVVLMHHSTGGLSIAISVGDGLTAGRAGAGVTPADLRELAAAALALAFKAEDG